MALLATFIGCGRLKEPDEDSRGEKEKGEINGADMKSFWSEPPSLRLTVKKMSIFRLKFKSFLKSLAVAAEKNNPIFFLNMMSLCRDF